ncbi:MAG: hypothetical protein Q8M07_00525, partial [Prosthecobacter sp.]|nr:hypothetical protein [Prosthecobacter sp.]
AATFCPRLRLTSFLRCCSPSSMAVAVLIVPLYTPPYLMLQDLWRTTLAAAKLAGETEIVATDKRLREAALLLGFSVFPPV